MDEPLISVVILSFETPSLVLRRTIRSVLEQRYHPIQVVLVDANPPESDYSLGLREDMEQFPQVQVLSCPCRKGEFALAKNLGARESRGKYLAYLMAPDAWNQECAGAQVAALESQPQLGMVFCQCWELENDAFSTQYRQEPPGKEEPDLEILPQEEIHSVSQVMFRRSSFRELQGFDTRIQSQDDYDMWLRMMGKYKIAALDRNLVCNYLDQETLKKSHHLVNVVGYLQLGSKHRDYYRKNPESRRELYQKIAACYKEARRYLPWAKYEMKIRWLEYQLAKKKGKRKEALPERRNHEDQ